MTLADRLRARSREGVGHVDVRELMLEAATALDAAEQALRNTLDYWTETGFAPCDPGCDCVVDEVRAALAQLHGVPPGSPQP